MLRLSTSLAPRLACRFARSSSTSAPISLHCRLRAALLQIRSPMPKVVFGAGMSLGLGLPGGFYLPAGPVKLTLRGAGLGGKLLDFRLELSLKRRIAINIRPSRSCTSPAMGATTSRLPALIEQAWGRNGQLTTTKEMALASNKRAQRARENPPSRWRRGSFGCWFSGRESYCLVVDTPDPRPFLTRTARGGCSCREPIFQDCRSWKCFPAGPAIRGVGICLILGS